MLEALARSQPGLIALAILAGMVLGAALIWRFRQRVPSSPAWQILAYGGGMFLGGLLLGGCLLFFAGPAPGAVPPKLPTPTATPRKPTATPTPPRIPSPTQVISPTVTPTATPMPALPATFDITLNFTNNSCSYPDAAFPFRFTIDGGALTLLQVDANITTTGTYDAATGAFMTSGTVGPGTETYEGVITFDGAMISVTGTGGYAQAGQCTSVNDIAGETTVP